MFKSFCVSPCLARWTKCFGLAYSGYLEVLFSQCSHVRSCSCLYLPFSHTPCLPLLVSLVLLILFNSPPPHPTPPPLPFTLCSTLCLFPPSMCLSFHIRSTDTRFARFPTLAGSCEWDSVAPGHCYVTVAREWRMGLGGSDTSPSVFSPRDAEYRNLAAFL
jgi:hypothetical protein